ncbi:hypothetical protein O3X23_07040 [Streptomyces sp. H39-S7]|nr:hypothetical protein [Streptomyces sp. H39-S7]
MRQFRQQPHHGGRTAAGQQPGRFGVTPTRPTAIDQPISERGAPPGNNRPNHLPPHSNGSVFQSRNDRIIGKPPPLHSLDRDPTHHRIRIRDPDLQIPMVPPDRSSGSSQPPLISPTLRKLPQHPSQLTPPLSPPHPPSQLPHPRRIGQRLQGREEFVGK